MQYIGTTAAMHNRSLGRNAEVPTQPQKAIKTTTITQTGSAQEEMYTTTSVLSPKTASRLAQIANAKFFSDAVHAIQDASKPW